MWFDRIAVLSSHIRFKAQRQCNSVRRYYQVNVKSTNLSALYSCKSFTEKIQNEKIAAKKSIVIEDKTKNGSFWVKTLAEFDEFFIVKPSNVFRWRIFTFNGQCRRFLLVEFDSLTQRQKVIESNFKLFNFNLSVY